MKINYMWIDNLRFISTIAVIMVHVSFNLLNDFDAKYNWWVGNFYDSLCHFAVPVFVMITGSLQLQKKITSLSVYIKKMINRIVIPFIFWSIIYLFWDITIYNNFLSFFDSETFFKLIRGTSYHLWYVYMIIGIYLFIPIIRKWSDKATDKEFYYFFSICFFSLVFSLPIISKISPDLNLIYFSGYLGYLVLGFFLTKKKINVSKNNNFILTGLLLFGLSLTIFGTYFLSSFKGVFIFYLFDYLTPNIFFISIAVFLLFKINSKKLILGNFQLIVNKYSYGIYLSHVIVLSFFNICGLNNLTFNPLFSIPLISLLCLLTSLGLVFVLSKIPLGNRVSG